MLARLEIELSSSSLSTETVLNLLIAQSFRKDTRIIKKQELIFLWIAHEYISSKGILEVEDVGDEIKYVMS